MQSFLALNIFRLTFLSNFPPALAASIPGPTQFQCNPCRPTRPPVFSQLTNENVDDLDLWLVHATVELVENMSLVSVVPLRKLESSKSDTL